MFRIKCIWIALVISFLCFKFRKTNGKNEIENFRLPTSVIPTLYELKILTHLNDGCKPFHFFGNVKIHIDITEPTNNITLHAVDLDIDSKKIKIENITDSVKISEFTTKIDKNNDFFIINLKETLLPNLKYTLSIPFDGKINKGLYGYYQSSYKDPETNQTKYLSVTQFEPIHARKAFPCFDEPAMKAEFKISLGHLNKYKAISNMPVKYQTKMKTNPNFVWDHFEKSVPMSTYLVAYSVNDFIYKETLTQTKKSVTFRTWARKTAVTQLEYASKIGPQVLSYYENYFDIDFPLPKIDQIAIPDFAAGAMENWGLVTYRETALLYEPNISSSSNQHRVASVIAHELAHQWFGNLVTMKWWTDLWLNEGFATYVASLGVEHLHPEWESFKEESIDNTFTIFKVDALNSSHPISVEISDPSQISQIFDPISYNKGSCVLRMMQKFLGEETFRNGVAKYLKKFSYQNALQDDLWNSLTTEAHLNKIIPHDYSLKTIMDSWTLQTGYPVIKVTRNYSDGSALISQERFLLNRDESLKTSKNCWWIPLSFTNQNEANFDTIETVKWIECSKSERKSITIENIAKSNEWVIFNLQVSGLYKVEYDEENWKYIINTLRSPNFKQINTINRAQLIYDALDLAWTGKQDYDIGIDILDYLYQEEEYLPWKAALSNLAILNRVLQGTDQYSEFKEYMNKLITPIYYKLNGLENQTVNNGKLDAIKHKVLVAKWACYYQVDDCISKSKDYFEKWQMMEDPDKNNPIPLDLRPVIYCTAVRHGNETDWDFLLLRYKKSNVASEKHIILLSLGCTKDENTIKKYLELSVTDNSGIRSQDLVLAFEGIVSGYKSTYAKEFLFNNIEKIHKYLEPDSSKLGRFVKAIAAQSTNSDERKEIQNFVQKYANLLNDASKAVSQALETIDINIQWRTENYQKLAKAIFKKI